MEFQSGNNSPVQFSVQGFQWRPGREADHSPPSVGAEVMYMWSSTIRIHELVINETEG
jgi:hypothetical protein